MSSGDGITGCCNESVFTNYWYDFYDTELVYTEYYDDCGESTYWD